jgi:acetyl-CoA acetyltransferase
VVLAAGDAARALCDRPAWIRGIDHRIDGHDIGRRDLTAVPSATLAAERAGAGGRFDVAELHAPFSHEELLLRRAMAVDADVVNPSGGALCANPVMAAGLVRFGEVAARIHRGEAGRGLAHATSGPCLQQNLVAVLEADG